MRTERIRGIAAFVEAAETGSFAGAARNLRLMSSAIAESVARLEERLSVRLFERSTRALRLTRKGRGYFETCSRALKDLAEAESSLSGRSKPEGTLRVDLPAAYGRLIVMPILFHALKYHPELRAHITFTDRFVDLIEEDIDMAVRIGGDIARSTGISSRHLGTKILIYCASPGYLRKRGGPRTLDDLPTHDMHVYGRMPDAGGAQSPASNRLVLGDAEVLRECAREGLGTTQIATWLVQGYLDSGELVQVLKDDVIAGKSIYALWRSPREKTAKVSFALQALADAKAI